MYRKSCVGSALDRAANRFLEFFCEESEPRFRAICHGVSAFWAAILALVHIAVAQNVHLRGRPWLYYVYGSQCHHAFPLRHDLLGLANCPGLISVLIVLVLLATWNSYSLRALGTQRF